MSERAGERMAAKTFAYGAVVFYMKSRKKVAQNVPHSPKTVFIII